MGGIPKITTSSSPAETSASVPAKIEPTPTQPAKPKQSEFVGEKLANSESTFTEPEEFVRKERPWRLLTVVAIALGLIPAAFYSPLNRDDLGRPKTVQQLGEDTWRSVEDLTGELIRTVKKMTASGPGENHRLWSWANGNPFLDAVGIGKEIAGNGEYGARFTSKIDEIKVYKSLQDALRWCQGKDRDDLIDLLKEPENKKLYPTLGSLDIPKEGGIEDYIPWQITEKYKTPEARKAAFEKLELELRDFRFGSRNNKPTISNKKSSQTFLQPTP